MEMFHKFIDVAGDYSSLIGLLLTLATFYQAWKSRQAAEEARNSLCYFDAIHQTSTTIAMLEEMAVMQRNHPSWEVLADRYLRVKKNLIQVKKSCPDLTEDQETDLTKVISTINDKYNHIEKNLSTPEKIKSAKLNQDISGVSAVLNEFVADLKSKA